MVEFGSVLRKMRVVADISQEEMAEKLHMSRSNVSRLENNRMELKAVDLIKWCRATNNPDVLMALYAGIDVTATLVTSGATALITGTIAFLGGIL
ncbi:helix-turn-helix domain-containing protein [Oceanobacillus luteolus]|uniref:helix-turn-helix domain-containing protein n=1 Tax=Oceanobacillus luteolus TaxID=1274358 RepID=UPI00203C7032|nr:helix-turn-helix transcriptional regulator [Oceanobacillus luteolus]MCM3739193.1 helix-turn-helix domain-containing protein [Oceanobacillus luteolus]